MQSAVCQSLCMSLNAISIAANAWKDLGTQPTGRWPGLMRKDLAPNLLAAIERWSGLMQFLWKDFGLGRGPKGGGGGGGFASFQDREGYIFSNCHHFTLCEGSMLLSAFSGLIQLWPCGCIIIDLLHPASYPMHITKASGSHYKIATILSVGD